MTTDDDLTVVSQVTTCEAAPVQIEGTLSDGRRFYFRSRHRRISLGASTTRDGAVAKDLIVLTMAGFDDDGHPLSSLSDQDSQALLAFLVRVLHRCETYTPPVWPWARGTDGDQ
jgi:hypothetical protein